MIETKDIKTYAKNMFARSDSAGGQDLMNPNREWFILSMLFLVLFISGAVFSVQQYQMYERMPNEVEVTRDLTVPPYQESRVLDVHEYFSERSQAYQLLLQQSSQQPATTTPESDESAEEETDIDESIETETGVVEEESID